jgi:molybdate transport system permease protein
VSGCLLGFARALGEFGATITFASNIAGETRTLPLAIYTAINSAGGDAEVRHLVILSLILAIAAIGLAGVFEKRVRILVGQRRA